MNLVFDADDTLWENNIYFERAFDDFCEFLNHSKLTPAQVREVLNEIELCEREGAWIWVEKLRAQSAAGLPASGRNARFGRTIWTM